MSYPLSPRVALRSVILFLGLFLAVAAPVSSATSTWTAAGGTSNFSDATNWDAFPTPNCIMVFPAGSPFASKGAPVNDLIGLTIDQLIISESYTISGNAISCKNINDQAASTANVTLPISTAGGAVLTITVSSATGTLNLSGRLTGAGPVTYAGPGFKRLNGTVNNTLSGMSIVALGTLVLDSTAAESIAGPLVINSGGTVLLKSAPEIKNSIVVTVNGTFDCSAATGTEGLVTETIGGLAGTDVSAQVLLGANTLGCTGQVAPTNYVGGFTGTGGFRQATSGTEVLSGTSFPYTGASILAGGELHIWGSLINSPVSVSAGTLVLANDCMVGNVLLNGSASRLSCNETMSAMAMHGTTPSLTLGSGSTFVIVAKSPTRFTQISTAAVSLTGSTLSVDTASFSPAPASVMTIIINTGASPVTGTFTGLAEGATVTSATNAGTSFQISYVGGAGHDVTLTGMTVATDTVAPAISAVTPAAITSSTTTVTWTTDEVSTSSVEFGLSTSYGSQAPVDASLVTSHTVSLSNLAGGTLYHFRVTSQDAAGNRSQSSDGTFTTTADTTPPVITGISPSATGSSSTTVTWTTDEVADSQVEFGLTATYGSTTALDSSQVSAHNVLVAGLTPVTAYHYRVLSRDAAGNLAVSSDATFTTTSTTTPGILPPAATDDGSTGTCGAGGSMALFACIALGLMLSTQRWPAGRKSQP